MGAQGAWTGSLWLTVEEADVPPAQMQTYVDATSQPMVDGTTIDFVRKGLNHEFVFANPSAAAECGCGESFTTDADRAG